GSMAPRGALGVGGPTPVAVTPEGVPVRVPQTPPAITTPVSGSRGAASAAGTTGAMAMAGRGDGTGGGRGHRQRRSRRGKKEDIRQIEDVAREFDMTPEQRREFGDFVEEMKVYGHRGTKNERGDFTYQELRGLARQFLGME